MGCDSRVASPYPPGGLPAPIMDAAPDPTPEPTPEELAREWAERASEGDPPPLESFLARLGSESERRELRELVAAFRAVERSLPRAARALSAGQLVAGRYELVRRLGEGGMGQVWEALDRRLERRVALKFLDAASQGRADREALFEKESRLLASLRHPGLVAVHEFGRDGGLTYIVMELVPGRSLAQVLESVRVELRREGAPPQPRDARRIERAIGCELEQGRTSLFLDADWFRCGARIARELARILEAAHGARVVHRDLKPSNVMLTGGGNPVVLDFGLAGSAERAQGEITRNLYGSLPYLAPEQVRSNSVGTDPRTDVYQLGLLLYELLTLQRAFPGEIVPDVLERIQLARFPRPREVRADVPRELEAICLCALELDPARRYPGARELAQDLERWLTGRELPRALGAGALRRAARAVRWHVRQRPWLSGCAGLALAALLAWGFWPALDDFVRAGKAVRIGSDGLAHVIAPGGSVGSGDFLGVYLDCRRPVKLFALAASGADSAHTRVRPRRAATRADPKRYWNTSGPFALELSAGTDLVYGSLIEPEPEAYEATLLLAVTGNCAPIEDWMRGLQAEGEDGVRWDLAREQLLSVLHSRGPMDPEFPVSDELIERLRKVPDIDDPFWDDLPGVVAIRVECRGR